MNADACWRIIEQIADAPDAIARLRRFILDLAVRGKLVPQDANDEPASELLKRIAKEKDDEAEFSRKDGARRKSFPILGSSRWRRALNATTSDRKIGPVRCVLVSEWQCRARILAATIRLRSIIDHGRPRV